MNIKIPKDFFFDGAPGEQSLFLLYLYTYHFFTFILLNAHNYIYNTGMEWWKWSWWLHYSWALQVIMRSRSVGIVTLEPQVLVISKAFWTVSNYIKEMTWIRSLNLTYYQAFSIILVPKLRNKGLKHVNSCGYRAWRSKKYFAIHNVATLHSKTALGIKTQSLI